MNASVVKQGASAPLGATVYPGGVNFSVFSKNAVLIELLLFDDENAHSRQRSYLSMLTGSAPITTGMSLFPILNRARFMPTEPMGHSRRNVVFASMARRFSSILMVSP